MKKNMMLLLLLLLFINCQPDEEDLLVDFNLKGKNEVQANNARESANRIRIKNIEALRKLPIPNKTRKEVTVLGYSEPGDGGGGLFTWNSTSTEEDNGGTIISAKGMETGRWERIFDGAVNVKWFGAKGDGVTDDTASVKAAISKGLDVDFDNGVFLISSKLEPLQDKKWGFINATLKMEANFPNTESLVEVNQSGVVIDAIRIDGNKINLVNSFSSGVTGAGVVIRAGGNNFRMEGAVIEYCITNGFVVYGNGVHDILFKDSLVRNNDFTGAGTEKPLSTDSVPYNVTFDNITAEGNYLGGFYFAGTDNLFLTNCRTKQSGNRAVFFYIGDSLGTLKNCKVVNCHFETLNNSVDAVQVQGKVQTGGLTGSYGEIDVSFVNTKITGAGGGSLLKIDGKATINGFGVELENGNTGLKTVGGSIVTLKDLHITDTSSYGIIAGSKIKLYDAVIENFGSGTGNQAGVILDAGSDFSVFMGCQFGNLIKETGEFGLWNYGNVENVTLINNRFGAVTTNINSTAVKLSTWKMLNNSYGLDI